MLELDTDAQRHLRKGRERDLHSRDPSKEPQPTDLNEKLIALRRRNAAASINRPRDRSERPPPPPPPPARADRSPKPAHQTSSRHSASPRKIIMSPQVVVSRPQQDADPDDFSRRLKISTSSSPRLVQQNSKQTQKLFDPERDPIPTMRRMTEPEPITDVSSSPRSGPTREAAPARQLFNYRKDDPVRFAVLARPQQQGRPTPTPKSSGDYISASSASSYAPSQTSSSFTLSSNTTDGSSASSALFDGQRKSADDPGNNVFAVQLKKLYRTITGLESKVNQDDSVEADDTSRIRLKGKEQESEGAEVEKWKKRLEDHKSLVENIHRLLEMSLAPTVPASLRNIPTKYNIIVRLWTYGFYKLLEALRRASLTSPLALEHLQDFIYYAYTFYTGLLEEPYLASFKSGWLEALGDLARYKMAVAALVTGGPNGGGPLTSENVTEVLLSTDNTNMRLMPPPADAKSLSDEPAARIDDSPSPSVGVVAARQMEIEPDKERWRCIARDWYGAGLADQPGTGKLHHHLGLLSRDTEGEELRGVYHFVKSMTTLHPFMTSRESVLPIWTQTSQARRNLPDAKVPDLFVLLHGMLFTNIELDAFQPTLARFVERLEIEGAQDREWIMMAVVNIGSILEYGKPDGVLKKLGGIGSRDPGSVAAMRVMAKREMMADDSMDVDNMSNANSSPSTMGANVEPSEVPVAFKYALQLAFSMFSFVLRHPTRKVSPYARSTINPYLTVILTFLSTILKHAPSREALERDMPWEDMAAFFATVPRSVMASQQLNIRETPGVKRWDMVTSGCAPPLAEDWCLRGMEWVGRKVYERGYWKSGAEKNAELEVLDDAEIEDITDGHIEDDDDYDGEGGNITKRWVRIVRCGIDMAEAVPGFKWMDGTREWRVEGALAQKVQAWREEEAQDRAKMEERRMGTRWADESMDVDDNGTAEAEESESDDENDSDQVKALKARRRYLQSLISSSPPTATSRLRTSRVRSCRKAPETRPPLSIQPGYTVLVVDTNILLSSLPMFASVVESLKWTVLVPLPVIMELDGISHHQGQLGEAAQSAMTYLSSHIRSHSTALKVQTSKGNYLQSLNVRTEEVDFTSGMADRNMDDLILKAAIWHDEHWMDRSALLQNDGPMKLSNPLKVVLLSLDRNLRLKARSRQLPAASEKDLAWILTAPS